MAGGDASLGSAALDPNWVNRMFEAMKTRIDELQSSIGPSVSGIVNEITARFPVASVIPYAGTTAPTGWLLADGAAVSRVTYSDLFAVIGTTYGVGDGSTTFNVPNLKGRIPVGQDAAQSEFNVIGETGGAKTHTLSATEMPSHTHSYQDSTTSNGFVTNGTGSSETVQSTRADFGRTTGSAGGNGAHNNLQPYIVMNHIIKV